MKSRILIVTFILLTLLASMLPMTGCSNTWKGIGKDVEKTGEKMQEDKKQD